MNTILVVDDEQKMQEILKRFLTKCGYNVLCANSLSSAYEKFSNNNIDLVITDVKMPKGSGIELLKKITKYDSSIPVIVITAYSSIQTAISAIKEGAFDYIIKPFDLDEFKIVIERALTSYQAIRELKQLKAELKQKYLLDNIIGKSKSMQDIFEIIYKVADTNYTILITGESGTGKELVAKALHYNSKRSDKPFIVVNCSAIPTTLLESELFGYQKGAFTDAYKDKPGYLEIARGGSIFLDEIAEISPELQVKLLRVLEHKKFLQLGGVKEIDIDVRFIAATNKNLKEKIKEGKFREDLFYRLNVVNIEIPPLRHRKEDIPILCEYFLSKQKDKFTLSQDALQILFNYHWPGNVRELENAIERITLFAKGKVIEVDDIPEEFKIKESNADIQSLYNIPYQKARDKFISNFEEKYFTSLLEKNNGDVNKAANSAKISPRYFYKKLKEYNIKI